MAWPAALELGDWLAAAGDSAGALEAYRRALEWKLGEENTDKTADGKEQASL